MKVYTLSTCDAWISSSSMSKERIFAKRNDAINFAKKEFNLSKDDLFLLEEHNQTQGRSKNLIIEEDKVF